MRRLLAMLLLPLSVVPVALAVPHVGDQLTDFRQRYVERDAFAAPRVENVVHVTVPAHRDRIPVLVYHGISRNGARETVTREAFAAQMAALSAAGYRTVSAETYARFARGEPVQLPRRPVLITFDDGRLDSFRGADQVLERYDFRATMFVITGVAGAHSAVYLGADELRDMARNGRWDLGLHAGHGHRQIRAAQGGERPFYAAREPGESVDAYIERVRRDLSAGQVRLREILPEARTDLFAVPYSDYAQTPGAEPAVRRALVRELKHRFTATFVQRDPAPFARRGQTGLVARYEARRDTTPRDLLRALRDGARKTTKTKKEA